MLSVSLLNFNYIYWYNLYMSPLDKVSIEEDKEEIKKQVDELTLILQNRYSLAAEKFKEVLIGKMRGEEIDESEDIMKWLALYEALSDYQ